MMSTGASPGLALRKYGWVARPAGSSLAAALIAACTSRAAPSMLRDRSNCMMMVVPPSSEVEVISDTPAMAPSWRSSGAATEDAMVAGSAPGCPALIMMVGQLDARQRRDGQVEIGHQPAQHDADRQQRCGDRPADEGGGDVHRYSAACTRAGATRRRTADRSRSIAR